MSNFCMMCGKPLVPGTPYCGECGAKVAELTSTSAPAPPVAPVSSVPLKKSLSWWVAVLIALAIIMLFGMMVSYFDEKAGGGLGLLFSLAFGIWAGKDAKRINLYHYRTHLPVRSMGVFMFFLWIVAFPWYLVVRSKIKAGVMPTLEHVGPPPAMSTIRVVATVCGVIVIIAVICSALYLSSGSSVKGVWATTNPQTEAANTTVGASTSQTDKTPTSGAPATSPTGGACLSYSPAVVTLKGTITAKKFPGLPNFESIEKGDEPEAVWILALTESTCTSGQKVDEHAIEAEANVRELQLTIGDQQLYERYQPLLGRTVNVSGTLDHAVTGHHHTPVILEVTGIEPSAGSQ